jgi:nucleotide-binding universal stress UspA family protein
MFQLLIATDGSADGEKALRRGLGLAEALSAKVTVATVTDPWTEAAYATLPTPSLVQISEKAAAARAAKDEQCDLNIVGSHGRGALARAPRQRLFASAHTQRQSRSCLSLNLRGSIPADTAKR